MEKLYKSILASVLLFSISFSCTDLEEEPFNQAAADGFFNKEIEFQSAVASVYQHMTGFSFWYFMVMENASDALTIYTHSTGWNNDRHRRTDTHQLRASDNRAFPLNQSWNLIHDGIAKANWAITSIENNAPEGELKDLFLSEARVLRAWMFFLGMDVYGDMIQVTTPFPDPNEELPSRTPRAEVFTFVENELLDAIPNLPSGNDASHFPRVNQETAHAILAHLYLNAEVFTGTARWQDCIDQCDAILNQGSYNLASDYFSLFSVNNDAQASEMLFYVDHEPGVSGGSVHQVRHCLTQPYVNEYYNLPYNVWNGPAVQMSFWDQYDVDDIRRNEGFLSGVQFTQLGDTLKDGNGVAVNHTREFYLRPDDPDAPDSYLALYEGIRPIKFEPDNNAVGADQGNGFPLIRLADIMLQKAECLIRLNGPNATSDNLVNQIRARVFEPNKPLAGVTLDQVYWERGFELFGEGHRRRDQIRFDTFHLADDFHDEHDKNFNLFPIPQDQIDANPNLAQNLGY